MLNASINGRRFKEFVSPMSAFVKETVLNINTTGLSTKAIDQASVALVEASLSSSAFDENTYNATNGKIGISLLNIKEISELIDDDDTVGIRLDTETQSLVISVGGMDYSSSLIDINSIMKPVQIGLDIYPVKIVMRGIHLKRGVKASNMVSQFVFIKVNRKGVIIKASGTSKNVKLVLKKNQLISLDHTEDISALFSLDYLVNIASKVKKDSNITIELANGQPLKISMSISDNYGIVNYYLAPRVENEQ